MQLISLLQSIPNCDHKDMFAYPTTQSQINSTLIIPFSFLLFLLHANNNTFRRSHIFSCRSEKVPFQPCDGFCSAAVVSSSVLPSTSTSTTLVSSASASPSPPLGPSASCFASLVSGSSSIPVMAFSPDSAATTYAHVQFEIEEGRCLEIDNPRK